MVRSPSSDENGLKKGPWTSEEDEKLVLYIQEHGLGSWRALPKLADLNRCGKSCRLRWTNYLRPNIKRGKFSQDEEQTILHLHSILGNKWSAIATHLPGRTDNEIKNFWNTHLKKKLIQMGFDPMTHQPRTDLFSSLPHLIALANLTDQLMEHHHHHPLDEHSVKLQPQSLQMANFQCLQHLLQSAVLSSVTTSPFRRHGTTDMDHAYNSLFNSSSSVSPNMETPILNSLHELENVVLQPFSHEIGSSQLLHHHIPSNQMADPQVPFSYQTPLNSGPSGAADSKEFMVVSQGDNNNPPSNCWAQLDDYPSDHDYCSTDFSLLPPLAEVSMNNNNHGDGGGSTSSSYVGGDSSCWSELCFDGPLFHENS